MSLAAPGARRYPWVIAAAFLAAAIAASVIVLSRPSPHHPPSPATPAADPVAPEATHESWAIKAYPTGAVTRVTKAQRARVDAQEPRLERLVHSTYTALFLTPSELKPALAARFTPSASDAFAKARVGLPSGTKKLEKLRVVAKVGVQAQGAARAAALVRVVVAGEARGKEFALLHRGTLWLERRHHAWKVVGFDLDQAPYSPPKHKGSEKKGGGGKHAKGKAKKGRGKR